MAYIGVSKPYIAEYTNNNGAVSYGTPEVLGRATEVNITLDGKDPVVLYADNGPVESVTTFGGGNVTMGLDDLALAIFAKIMGVTKQEAATLALPGDIAAPYFGLAFIGKRIYRAVAMWRLVILHKTQFKLPDLSLSTQGETVGFQTPSLEASILRDDKSPAKWSSWGDYETEAAAEAAMMTFFGA